ncbi:MAG TPA: hypothetical protein VFT38_16575 [Vicinamibacteria bacterium]|nr:hypothetical protein [Vicinamibacteria bacterium]
MKADRRWAALAGIALLLLAARLPLHLVTWALPVSNDDAIPLLMARHVLRGELSTILWNQPYNGTLDTYLLAPGLSVAGHHAVFRIYEAVCGILLVVAAAACAGRLQGRTAAWAAAALAAVGMPYMALMAATGPTPNFLIPLLVSVPVLAGFRALGDPSRPRSWWRGGGLGLVCGLAVWNSALAIPALAGAAAGLAAAGWRPRARAIAVFAAGLALGASPLAVARIIHASASSPVTALRPRWLWMSGARDLMRAAGGLFGLQVPLVVDGPERALLPTAAAVALGAGLALLVVAGIRDRRALPLLGWAAALSAGFALSRRTGGDEVRYLYGLTVPVLALAGAGAARLGARAPVVAAVGAVAVSVPWLLGQRVLTATWRNPEHASLAWQVPPLEPVLGSLQRAGVRSGYASLQFAARLPLESGEAIVASQAWNERIPGDPLRFRDEVDLDPRAAWVLSSRLSRGMPRAGGFRELLAALGGAWHEDVAAEFSIFRAFRPPYDETRPVPAGEMEIRALDGSVLPDAVRDRDPRTAWTSPQGIGRGSGLIIRVPPRRLSALVLRVPLDPTPLAARWVCEADGVVVASGPLSHTLQWVNGAPRAGRQALLTVVLPGTSASEVRLIFQDAGPPLGVGEVFLYGPDEGARPADGAAAAESAYGAARRGSWDEAVRLYGDALRAEPDRASYHACLARAEWRAARRRYLDVESLDDGGAELVERR